VSAGRPEGAAGRGRAPQAEAEPPGDFAMFMNCYGNLQNAETTVTPGARRQDPALQERLLPLGSRGKIFARVRRGEGEARPGSERGPGPDGPEPQRARPACRSAAYQPYS
jgi:hypothetical protein